MTVSSNDGKILGIDLGTTYSAIAMLDEYGKPVVVPNREGERITPSVVFFDGDDVIVGSVAKRNAVAEPEHVVQFVKREMGNADYQFEHNKKNYTPEAISSLILRKVVGDASEALGVPIKDVVITCPAWFGDNQRNATKNAGALADLNVLQILNEPTAAALAYGMNQEGTNKTVMVYDLGGGTFDVTIIRIKDREICVEVTGGDHHLGGKDWDDCLIKYCAGEFQKEHGEDPLSDLVAYQDLCIKTEEAKKDLSSRAKTAIMVTHNGKTTRVEVTREKFEELTTHLVEKATSLTDDMLKEAAKKGCEKFDEIILVGGSSRMPMIAKNVEAKYKVRPKLVDPDEGVAKGAAIMGNILKIGQVITAIEKEKKEEQGDPNAKVQVTAEEVADKTGVSPQAVQRLKGTKTTNVLSKTLGIIALDDDDKEIVSTLMERNTALDGTTGVQRTKLFGTSDNNQTDILIQVMEGESHIPAECEKLGEGTLLLPPGLPKRSPVEVTFSYSPDGMLHIHAIEKTQNRACEFKIKRNAGMTDAEVQSQKKSLMEVGVS